MDFLIIDHFTRHDLFHPNHQGSLANHSTATPVVQLFDLLLEAAEQKYLSAVCLIDQSAAYDLLCHQTFSKKLRLGEFTMVSQPIRLILVDFEVVLHFSFFLGHLFYFIFILRCLPSFFFEVVFHFYFEVIFQFFWRSSSIF